MVYNFKFLIRICVVNYCVFEMKVLVFMALLNTCVCKGPSKPRSVNLALETVVQFDQNDNSADIQIIDKVRSFLDRVKLVIDKKKGYRRSGSSQSAGISSGRLKLTDFIKNALIILGSYDDSDLEDVVAVVNDEIRKYRYKGCKFHELVENGNVRRAMANNLEKIKNAPAKEIKQQINKMLRTFQNDNFDMMQQVVVDYVNSLYGDKAENKFKAVLDELATYRRKSNRHGLNLVKIIRNGLRSIVFDHYSRLNSKIRQDLKLKLETFWDTIINPQKETHQPGRMGKSDEELKCEESVEIKKGRSKHRNDNWKFRPLDWLGKLNEELKGEEPGSVEIKKGRSKHRNHIWKPLDRMGKLNEELKSEGPRSVEIKKDPSKHRNDNWKFRPLDWLGKLNEELNGEGPRIWNFKHLDGMGKSNEEVKDERPKSFEIKDLSFKHPKRDKKVKRQRQRNEQTTRKHLTFITLYPEAMTVLEKRHVKTERTKSPKHLREQHGRLKDRSKKQPKAVRKIIAEHEAVINVKRDTMSRVIGAIEDLGFKPRQVSETPMKSSRKAKKRHRPNKRVSEHKNHRGSKKPKHKTRKSRKDEDSRSNESDEGLSIRSFEDNDFATKSFRKSNLNDSLLSNDTADTFDDLNSSTPIPGNSVIRKIYDLEKEIRDVKAQIKGNKDYSYERPSSFDQLDFWEGTTKFGAYVTNTPVITTNKATTTKTTTTTTTTTKPTTTKVTTTTKITTKLANDAVGAVFRSVANESDIEKKVIKIPEKKFAEKKVLEKKVVENKEEVKSNVTNVIPLSHAELVQPIQVNSSEIDYFSDHKVPPMPPMNITSIGDLERFLNETKPLGGDKIQHAVRKQMMDQLKGLLSKNPEGQFNYTDILPTTPLLSDIPSDPMNFLDVADEALK